MDHSLRMYQQNSANVGFESKWVVIEFYQLYQSGHPVFLEHDADVSQEV